MSLMNAKKLLMNGQSIRDADARALIARMSTRPGTARSKLIEQLVKDLKASGVWALLDCFWMFAGHAEQATFLNWKQDRFNCVQAGTGTGGFLVDRGWAHGASRTLAPGFSRGSTSKQFSPTNGHLSMQRYTPVGASGLSGVALTSQQSDGSGSIIMLANESANTMTSNSKINSQSHDYYRVSDTIAEVFGAISATSSTYRQQIENYQREIQIAANIDGNTSPLIFKGDGNTATILRSASIGAALTATQTSSLRTAIRAYLQALGAIA